MKWLMLSAGLSALGLAGTALYMRTVSHDADVWYVDPSAARPAETPNSYLIAGFDAVRFDAPPEAVARAFDDVALSAPRVTRLAGEPSGQWVTYIQTTRVFGFPDYISAKAESADGGTRLSVFSRSRFGRSDLGVNRARVEAWLAQLSGRLKNSD